jgi:hypothetical protein
MELVGSCIVGSISHRVRTGVEWIYLFAHPDLDVFFVRPMHEAEMMVQTTVQVCFRSEFWSPASISTEYVVESSACERLIHRAPKTKLSFREGVTCNMPSIEEDVH